MRNTQLNPWISPFCLIDHIKYYSGLELEGILLYWFEVKLYPKSLL